MSSWSVALVLAQMWVLCPAHKVLFTIAMRALIALCSTSKITSTAHSKTHNFCGVPHKAPDLSTGLGCLTLPSTRPLDSNQHPCQRRPSTHVSTLRTPPLMLEFPSNSREIPWMVSKSLSKGVQLVFPTKREQELTKRGCSWRLSKRSASLHLSSSLAPSERRARTPSSHRRIWALNCQVAANLKLMREVTKNLRTTRWSRPSRRTTLTMSPTSRAKTQTRFSPRRPSQESLLSGTRLSR